MNKKLEKILKKVKEKNVENDKNLHLLEQDLKDMFTIVNNTDRIKDLNIRYNCNDYSGISFKFKKNEDIIIKFDGYKMNYTLHELFTIENSIFANFVKNYPIIQDQFIEIFKEQIEDVI